MMTKGEREVMRSWWSCLDSDKRIRVGARYVAELLAHADEMDAALRAERQENGNLAGWLSAVQGVLTCAFDEKDCEASECQKHGVAKLLAERKARRGK